MTTPNKYADLRGEEACKMLHHLVLQRGGAKAEWERAEAELATEYPELTAEVREHEERETRRAVLGK